MKRNDNLQCRPTAGCLPVPLFNQKKRNRIPLTSTPSENNFFSHTEFMPPNSSPAPCGASGAYGSYQASGSSYDVHPSHQWNKQDMARSTQSPQHGSYQPAPTMRSYAPLPHPYKAGSTNLKMGTPGNLQRQQASGLIFATRQNQYQTCPSSQNASSQQTPHRGFSQMSQQSSCRPANPAQFGSLPRPVGPPSGQAAQTQNQWNFTSSFGPQKPTFVGKRSASPPQLTRETQTKSVPKKEPFDNSLRILTAVIDGMKHWSQFKDKVTYFFEIFATLDSAVTIGHHGAKNFLLRDGKVVVQCLFYENEQELPRLIRGQVHRCVGNYDRVRDVLVCVSIRAAKPSEVRNAQEAIKACDTHMRKLVRLLHEA
ncbi:spermatogenesis-associated protein 22 [Hippocampus zosterae]|uniref:spermatogenesis-associated protein 22 n=1 Tax=Hippocampus zosterae TaxID=109293 RepID=UPI00223E6368|nr:spermatogenesis-associated protein 22 [Hippocampus zosterae]XP_051903908.1 spermatogenesis-associated protein 22 [Hippocampus zosterae]